MDNLKGNIDCQPLVTQMEETNSDGENIVLSSKNLALEHVDGRKAFLADQPFIPNPMRIHCKKCNLPTWTEVEKRNSMATYLFCFLICFTCLGACGCCLIPCCMNRCKVVEHTCRNCNNYVGDYYPK